MRSDFSLKTKVTVLPKKSTMKIQLNKCKINYLTIGGDTILIILKGAMRHLYSSIQYVYLRST